MTRRLLAIAAACSAAACGGPSFDTKGPKIVEGPTASVIRDTSITVAWLTDERANSLVQYGEDDFDTVEIDNHFLITHVVTIKNLQPQTEYQLHAVSYDLFGNGPARALVLSSDGENTITTRSIQPPPDIVISEIMASPVDNNTGEFVELFNNGGEDVDLTGFTVTDHDDGGTDTLQAFPGSTTVLAPGAYALILDSGYIVDTYDIPPGTVLMTTANATLGTGLTNDDPISLFAAGQAVPASTYGTPDVVDTIPITTGIAAGQSVERIDVGTPDEPTNWCRSDDVTKSTPGRAYAACAP